MTFFTTRSNPGVSAPTLRTPSRRLERDRGLRTRRWHVEQLENRTLLNAGSLDQSFGQGGVTTTSFALTQATALATSEVVDSSGRIVVAGLVADAQGSITTVLTRYKPGGQLDSSFGQNGRIVTPLVAYSVIPGIKAGVVIDSSGRILVTGALSQPPVSGSAVVDFAVARYTPDGKLDTSFGTAGVAMVNIGYNSNGTIIPTDDAPSGIAVQPDGKIVVAGTTSGNPNSFFFSNYEFAVVRFNPDGSLDTSFGQNGRAIAAPLAGPFSTSYDNAVALAPDGKIVITGSTTADGGQSYNFTAVRFTTSGSLDSGFASGGIYVGGLASQDSPLFDTPLVIQSNDKIVLGEGVSGNFTLLRLNVDGTNDASFGTGGVVTTPMPTPAEETALALQTDGKIVAAGWNSIGGSGAATDFVLARYSGADGSLDSSFGSNGVVVVNPPVDQDKATAVAIAPDGKIVLAGSSPAFLTPGQTGTDIEVARFNANGTLDGKFGDGGRVTTRFSGSRYDTASATAVLPSGEILVAGSTSWSGPTSFGGSSFALAEYRPDGSLDTSFGQGGLVMTSFGGTNDTVAAIAVQPDGKIILAGTTNDQNANTEYFAVARYNANGSLDASFGQNGQVTINLGDSQDVASGVAIQPDGRIVVVGYANFPNTTFAAVRLTKDGSLDTSFGVGGIVTTAFAGPSFATTVVIQPDGKIVVGGEASSPSYSPEWALVRYNTDGSLDPTFGAAGEAALANTYGAIEGLAIQPDGKLVAVGTGTESGDYGTATVFQVVRFTTAGQLDPSFGTGGIVLTDLTPAGSSLGGPNDSEATSVVVQSDGKIVVGGATFNPGYYPSYTTTPNTVALVRYDSTGNLDPAFGSNGVSITSLVDGSTPGASDVHLALQPDGKVIAAFSTPASLYGGSNFGVARFLTKGHDHHHHHSRSDDHPREVDSLNSRAFPIVTDPTSIDSSRDSRTVGAIHVLKLKPRSWAEDGRRSLVEIKTPR